jgi:predicted NBD/HSP70 family sugar kinase
MREIWMRRETSRVEIAKSLGLDKSTISNNVNELLEMGVIVESSEGNASPQGGRKPVHITLNPHYGCVLGLELRPDCYTAVTVDLEGEIIYSRFEKIRISTTNLAEKFLEIVKSLSAELENKNISLLGIGVGISGVVNAHEGIIKFSAPFNITEETDFHSLVSPHLNVPVFIDNDANACVWGELAFHRRKDLKDFIFLLLEFWDYDPEVNTVCNRTGVGVGLVINGSVHYGSHYSAGEFKSIYMREGSVGQFSLTEEEQMKVQEEEQMREKFLRELGAHVALLVNTFDLSHVILGGYFEHYDQQTIKIFLEEIEKNWPYASLLKNKTDIWFSSFGDQAVAYGAAGMVLNTLFSDLEAHEGKGLKRNFRNGIVVF